MRHSKKSRNIAIKISRLGSIELVIPINASIKKAKQFLESKLDWLQKKIAQIERVVILENQIPIFGKLHHIEHQDHPTTSVTVEQDKLVVQCPEVIKNDVIKRYLKNTVAAEIAKIASEICVQHQLVYKSIKINSAKSKWGSCSSDKKLTFNWRLAFAPYHIVYYLVTHELCHIKEMNHGPRFWSLVEQIDPNYKSSRLWLRKNSLQLHSYYF